jgi:hypothetical protein
MYEAHDAFFGSPYIDEDADGDEPPHRMIHGGFVVAP